MRTLLRIIRNDVVISSVLFAGLLIVLFWPVLFDGRILLPTDLIDTMTLPFSQYFGPEHAFNSYVTDACLQFYPLKYFTWQAYHHGEFAFWNPFILNGYPQYLEGMWTYNVFLFLPFQIAFICIVISPMLIAGIAMYALLREYEVRRGVARIFATAYMLNALFITHLLAHFIPASFSFAPFVILFLHRYYRIPRLKYLAYTSLFLALGFIAGNLQTVGFLIFVVVCYYTTFWFTQENRTLSTLVKPLSITLGLALTLSSVMLIPMTELVIETIDGGAFFSTSLLNSYTIAQRLISVLLSFTFFIPQLIGSVRGISLHSLAGAYPQDFEGAIGFLPLFIAWWAAFKLWRSRPQIRPFVVLMALGFVIPVATPLFRYVYHRFFAVFFLGACCTGAVGLEELLVTPSVTLRKWLRVFAYALGIIAALLLVWSIAIIWYHSEIEQWATTHLLPRLKTSFFALGNPDWTKQRFREAIDYWGIARPETIFALLSCFLSIALLWYKDKLSTSTFLSVAWILPTFQLIYFARSWLPMTDASKYPSYPATTETNVLQQLSKNSRVYIYREIDTTKQFILMNNQNVVYGIPEATGYESLTPRDLYIYTAILHWKDSGLVSPKFLGKFNIGTLVRVKPLPFDSLPMIEHGPVWVYHNPYVGPRALLAHTAITVANDTEVLRRLSQDTATWPAVYFSSDHYPKVASGGPQPGDTITDVQDGGNSVRMNVHCAETSYLVLTDTYYPGWIATIDGKQTPIVRGNYCMRVVAVTAGNHIVEFQFHPMTFSLSKWISVLTLAVILTIMFWPKSKTL